MTHVCRVFKNTNLKAFSENEINILNLFFYQRDFVIDNVIVRECNKKWLTPVMSPELLSVLTMMFWLLLACSVPALVIRLVAVLSLLPLLFRFFLILINKVQPPYPLLFDVANKANDQDSFCQKWPITRPF